MKLILKVFMAICFMLAVASCKDPMSDTCFDESKVDPDGVCVQVFDPVCGCDAITYSNECFASIAGVTSWSDGACGD